MTRRSLWVFVMALAGLLASQNPSRADTTNTVLAKAAVLDGNVEYLQIGSVTTNLADEIHAAQNALAVSNAIAGTVLDLRFAGGDDSKAAQTTVNLFASKQLPLMILVNGETHDAAEALVSELRAERAGLVFESVSGPAQTNGESNAMVRPDIVVSIGMADERALMKNPFTTPVQVATDSLSDTNAMLPFVDHTSEADLVRAKIKDGDEMQPMPAVNPPPPQPPVIRDPALARAVDLIKGLAVARASHS